MIHHLDQALKELLTRELPTDLATGVKISFATPDDKFPPSAVTLPAIDFFLYDIRENRDLRDNEWRLERQNNGTVMKRRAPVRVDCSYLITAWSGVPDDPAAQEHWMLGEVMKVLLRFPTLPASVLQNKEELSRQEIPPPTLSLHAGQLQSMAEFWQALGGKPKAVLNFTVTIAVEPFGPVEAGPPVVERQIPGERKTS